MVVDEPLKVHDEYRGDTGRERSKQISPKGFRFASSTKERVQVSLIIHLNYYALLEGLDNNCAIFEYRKL